MKRNLLIVLSGLILICCKKEEAHPPCSLDYLENSSFLGMIGLCNAQPGFQLDFQGSSILKVRDSILYISISSLDSNITYHFLDSALYKCVYWEGNESYKLFGLQDGSDIGTLSHGTSISFRIRDPSCPTSSAFHGWIKE